MLACSLPPTHPVPCPNLLEEGQLSCSFSAPFPEPGLGGLSVKACGANELINLRRGEMRAKRRRKRQFLAGAGGGPCMSAITLAASHRKEEGWRGKAPRPGQVRASPCCAGPQLRQGKSCHQVPCKTDRGLAPNFKEEALWQGQGTRFDRKSFPREAGSLL